MTSALGPALTPLPPPPRLASTHVASVHRRRVLRHDGVLQAATRMIGPPEGRICREIPQ